MKLEPDLIFEIMSFAEDIPAGEYRDVPDLGGRDWMLVACHARNLHSAGFIEGVIVEDQDGRPACCRITDLSVKGHEFIALSKEGDAWSIAKNHFKKKAIVTTIDLLFEYMQAYVRTKIHLQ